jgi:hypothetical protein
MTKRIRIIEISSPTDRMKTKKLNIAHLEDFLSSVCNAPSIDVEIKPLKESLYGETGLLVDPFLIYVKQEGHEYALGFRTVNERSACYSFCSEEAAQAFLAVLFQLKDIYFRVIVIGRSTDD